MSHQDLLLDLEPREHISPFQVNLFTDCPARYFETYRFHTRTGGKSVPLEFGDLIHNVIEQCSVIALAVDDPLKQGRVYEVMSESQVLATLDDSIVEYPQLVTPNNITRAREQIKYWYKKEAEREAKVITINTGHGEIKGIEVGFEKYLPNGVLIKGFIDRLEINKFTKRDEVAVIDWKTGFLADDYTYNMMIYVIACSGFDPDKRFTPWIYQLENEYFKRYNFEQQDFALFFDFIERVKLAILRFAQKIKSINDPEELEVFLNNNASLNKWCYTCRRKHKCIPYVTNILSGVPGISTVDRDPNLLVDYMDQLKLVEKSAKKEVGLVENILIDMIANRREELLQSEEEVSEDELKTLPLEDGRHIEMTRSKRRAIRLEDAIPKLIELKKTDKLSINLGDFETVIEQAPGNEQDVLRKMIFDSFSTKETPKVKGRKTKKK